MRKERAASDQGLRDPASRPFFVFALSGQCATIWPPLQRDFGYGCRYTFWRQASELPCMYDPVAANAIEKQIHHEGTSVKNLAKIDSYRHLNSIPTKLPNVAYMQLFRLL